VLAYIKLSKSITEFKITDITFRAIRRRASEVPNLACMGATVASDLKTHDIKRARHRHSHAGGLSRSALRHKTEGLISGIGIWKALSVHRRYETERKHRTEHDGINA